MSSLVWGFLTTVWMGRLPRQYGPESQRGQRLGLTFSLYKHFRHLREKGGNKDKPGLLFTDKKQTVLNEVRDKRTGTSGTSRTSSDETVKATN